MTTRHAELQQLLDQIDTATARYIEQHCSDASDPITGLKRMADLASGLIELTREIANVADAQLERAQRLVNEVH